MRVKKVKTYTWLILQFSKNIQDLSLVVQGREFIELSLGSFTSIPAINYPKASYPLKETLWRHLMGVTLFGIAFENVQTYIY
ncbi:hypothetical protein TI10_14010 [Photorhabdus luminescens subsp. luminescens]|nr:hypothetical protein TI10_14010 [Photorhabdus luminescens subsp. luminescens]